jgi:DNA-binding GntR family transcriptional regulator
VNDSRTAERETNSTTEMSPGGDAADAALTRLIKMIMELELKPGTLVSESQLLQLVDMSRSGLRGVLQRLAQLRLISVLPRAGIVITTPDFLDIQKVFEARLGVEPYIARLAATRASDEAIRRLVELAKEGQEAAAEAISQGSSVASSIHFIALDRQLHSMMVGLCENRILEDTMYAILITNARIWNWFFHRNASRIDNHLFISHDDIVDAIMRRDPDAAEKAIKRHLERSWAILRAAFENVPGLEEAGLG